MSSEMQYSPLDEKALVSSRAPPPKQPFIVKAANLPAQIAANLFSRFISSLRPLAPYLIPLLVFSILIPAILFLSVSAGWIVWRNVAVGWEAPLYLQYGDGAPPYAEVTLPKLAAKQPYDVSLLLVVPATENNFVLGNFMTSVVLSTPANKTLTSIRRPAIVLPPKNSRLPFSSSRPSTLKIEVPLWAAYKPGTSNVIAHVEIGRRDGWRSIGNGEGREVSILTASLQGVLKHHGVRGLITRFPLFSALFSAVTFLSISTFILGLCLLPQWRGDLEPTTKTSPDEPEIPPSPSLPSDGSDSSSDGEKRRRRRRMRVSRSRSDEETRRVKGEEAATSIPSAQSPIRRRRSRLTKQNADPDSSD